MKLRSFAAMCAVLLALGLATQSITSPAYAGDDASSGGDSGTGGGSGTTDGGSGTGGGSGSQQN